MRFYSDQTGKLYDSIEELHKAESEYIQNEKAKKIQEEREKELRKERKQAIKDAKAQIDDLESKFDVAFENFRALIEEYITVYGEDDFIKEFINTYFEDKVRSFCEFL